MSRLVPIGTRTFLGDYLTDSFIFWRKMLLFFMYVRVSMFLEWSKMFQNILKFKESSTFQKSVPKTSHFRVIFESIPVWAPERSFEWVASHGVGTDRSLGCKLFRNTAWQLICRNGGPWTHHSTQDPAHWATSPHAQIFWETDQLPEHRHHD